VGGGGVGCRVRVHNDVDVLTAFFVFFGQTAMFCSGTVKVEEDGDGGESRDDADLEQRRLKGYAMSDDAVRSTPRGLTIALIL
jgi:hypothetical protein